VRRGSSGECHRRAHPTYLSELTKEHGLLHGEILEKVVRLREERKELLDPHGMQHGLGCRFELARQATLRDPLLLGKRVRGERAARERAREREREDTCSLIAISTLLVCVRVSFSQRTVLL